MPLSVGDPAPDFSLPTDRGGVFRLSAYRGETVVLYFYPQDGTEGCTVENVEFSRLVTRFEAAGAVVAGISPDSVEAHCRFRDRHGLAVTLLADPDHVAIGPYGVWGAKKLYGRAYEGLIRTTVVVAPDGRVRTILPVRRIRGHAAAVLSNVTNLA